MRIIIEPSDQTIDPDDFLSTVSALIDLTELTIVGACTVTIDNLPVVETTFEITKLDLMGGPYYTVWMTTDGVPVADHRWLSEGLAQSALRLYEVNPAFHGASAETVLNEFKSTFGEYPGGLIELDKKV